METSSANILATPTHQLRMEFVNNNANYVIRSFLLPTITATGLTTIEEKMALVGEATQNFRYGSHVTGVLTEEDWQAFFEQNLEQFPIPENIPTTPFTESVHQRVRQYIS